MDDYEGYYIDDCGDGSYMGNSSGSGWGNSDNGSSLSGSGWGYFEGPEDSLFSGFKHGNGYSESNVQCLRWK